VRLCAGCDRQVFNLSEMTRDEAEALLATRGIKPCVRFYRRADGTVKTTDCAPGARRSHRLTVITASTLLGASPAMADEAPVDETPPATDVTPTDPPVHDQDYEMGEPPDHEWLMGDIAEPVPATRPTVEWSTWARAGFGIATQPATFTPRTTTMPPLLPESSRLGEGALGLDVSLAVAHRGAIRLGAFTEWRTISEPVLGGELLLGGIGSRHGRGSMGLVLRGGGNHEVITGALGFGYTASDPWLGYHHATGLRMITSINRSREDARDWSATVGVELDPIGAIGYVVHRARR
jgi:hypothetical protein